jgi:AmmeMemoRadiSam system protein B
MPLVGCFVTPHPPIIIPEVGGAETARVEATAEAMRAVGEKVALLDPDTIVLLSPHAPLDRSSMGVSLAPMYKGSLAHFRVPEVKLSLDGDRELAKAITDGASLQGILTRATASPGEIFELDHGAMVPLHFIQAAQPEKRLKAVVLSFSYLSIEEHVRFGQAVGKVLMEHPARTVYIASSDLSHKLLPGASAGFDPRGAQFDQAVVDAFAAGDWEGLLAIDHGLVVAAGECGYRSLAVLAGVMESVGAAGIGHENRLLSYEGPFGVGYLVGEVEFSAVEEAGEAEGGA